MLLIFDWDGTLIDSADKIISCMQLAAADCGFPSASDGAIRNIIGLELVLAIQTLYPALELAQALSLRDAYAARFVHADQVPCQLFPFVEQVLSLLVQRGHRLGVATGKSRRGLDRVFSRLPISELFCASRCADETASKPDPLMLRELCAELGEAPEQAVMVGDTEYDLEMAQRLRMKSVGVAYGAHSPARLRKWQPEAVLTCFSQLPDIVGRLDQRQ